MRKEAALSKSRGIAIGVATSLLLSACGLAIALGQAPLPPPPPGPTLQVPGSTAPTSKPLPASPAAPVVEQLTVPPFEKREPTPIPPVSQPPGQDSKPQPTDTPAGSQGINPLTPPSSTPPIPLIPTSPPSSASPSASSNTPPTPVKSVAPPAVLSPSVQVAEPNSKPVATPAAPPTSPATPGTPNTPPTAAPAVPQKPAPAILIIEVPPQATLWIEDQRMSQTGPVRSFQSPPLQPGKTYLYKIRLSWPGPNGQPITTEHEITVQAGQTQRIDFRPLAQSLGEPSPAPPTITPLTPNPPPPPSPPRRIFPFIRPEGSGSQ